MRILFVGDVVGRPGRRAVAALVPQLRREIGADLVIANGENVAGGKGITADTAAELFAAGVDCLTGGNHTWDKDEGASFIDRDERILRPVNYPPGAPGRGFGLYAAASTKVAVVSLQGRIFMPPLDCPFRAVDAVLQKVAGQAGVVFVDFHAEATSEKIAMGYYLEGRVSVVVGTHTHVQTADERILARGTACLTDAGMTGAHDSIIGVRKELALRRMLTQLPVRFQPADADVWLHGVWIEVDAATGRATQIERVKRALPA